MLTLQIKYQKKLPILEETTYIRSQEGIENTLGASKKISKSEKDYITSNDTPFPTTDGFPFPTTDGFPFPTNDETLSTVYTKPSEISSDTAKTLGDKGLDVNKFETTSKNSLDL